MNLEIRKIRQSDNSILEKIIRNVLYEYDGPWPDSYYGELNLDRLYEHYSQERSAYFVATENKKLLGGMGIAPLSNFDDQTCELQRAFLVPESRGKGIGKALMSSCLKASREFGYHRIYLETISYMKEAIQLFKKHGFVHLQSEMGSTSHKHIDTWMMKELT